MTHSVNTVLAVKTGKSVAQLCRHASAETSHVSRVGCVCQLATATPFGEVLCLTTQYGTQHLGLHLEHSVFVVECIHGE